MIMQIPDIQLRSGECASEVPAYIMSRNMLGARPGDLWFMRVVNRYSVCSERLHSYSITPKQRFPTANSHPAPNPSISSKPTPPNSPSSKTPLPRISANLCDPSAS